MSVIAFPAQSELDAFVEDVEWMAETGASHLEAASRLGVKWDSLRARLRRAERDDLGDRLVRNTYSSYTEEDLAFFNLLAAA